MSFPYPCNMCAMKFKNELDLQIHGQVHPERRENLGNFYDSVSDTEPLFQEFLTAFFPRETFFDNEQDCHPPSNFSCPYNCFPPVTGLDDPSSCSPTKNEVCYTTLTNMKIPYDGSAPEEVMEDKNSVISAIPLQQKNSSDKSQSNQSVKLSDRKTSANAFITKLTSATELVNQGSVRSEKSLQSTHQQFRRGVFQPVLFARLPPSIAKIHPLHGDDRVQVYPQYYTSTLQPVILTKCLPSITKIGIRHNSVAAVSLSVSEMKEGNRDASLSDSDVVAAADRNNPKPSELPLRKRRCRNAIGKKPFMCDVCGKRFAFIKKFISHKQFHTAGKSFSCYLCHKRFGYSYELNQHMRLHTGENSSEYYSYKTYKNKTNLNRRSYKPRRKLKPYSCVICKRNFTRINYLNLHKRCHANPHNLQQTLNIIQLQASSTVASPQDSTEQVNEAT